MNEIVEGMARALYVSTYADWADEKRSQGCKIKIARGGEDWLDVAPETTQAAREQAWRLCGQLEQANNRNIYCLAAAAARADWPDRDACGKRVHRMALEVGSTRQLCRNCNSGRNCSV